MFLCFHDLAQTFSFFFCVLPLWKFLEADVLFSVFQLLLKWYFRVARNLFEGVTVLWREDHSLILPEYIWARQEVLYGLPRVSDQQNQRQPA